MKEYLELTLFKIGAYSITVSSILELCAFLLGIFVLLWIIKRVIYSSRRFDLAKKFAVYSLLKYFILVLACVLGLQILGFNVSVLMAGSAALLVGIGLGLQSLFSDFVSGIIILVEASVKVGDVIEINGLICKVQAINARTTTVLTREDKYIILPNTDLTRNQMINWTHNNVASRFEVSVGVDYASDVHLVMRLLKEAVVKHEAVLPDPEPFVRFKDYGDSSLNFGVYFWSEEVFRVENIKSEIRVIIFDLLQQHEITIPFPQRVVHVKQ